jgi:branched-chain amino acid transport system ATP-binding protein
LIFLPNGLVGFVRERFATAQPPHHSVGRGPVLSDALQASTLPVRDRSSDKTLIEVSRLSVDFGGVKALQDVSLSLKSGQILAVIGPNGAGKTTLFNLISGLYRPNHGRIFFEGEDVTALPVHARAKLGIARTFQNLDLFGEMTAFDNVRLGAHTRLHSTLLQAALRTRYERAEEARFRDSTMDLLEFVGLAAYANQRANSLAFGHQRLLEIARALALAPKVLLLDEPAAGLNSSEMDFLAELIRRIRGDFGISVLLIGHTMRLVMSLSDRVLVLDHGIPLAEGIPAEIQRDRRVIEAYLGADDA